MKLDIRSVILAFGLAAGFNAGTANAEHTWGRYVNDRYRFQICYPAVLKAQAEAPNGDGRVFRGADGGKLIVFGRNDVLNAGIDATAKEIAADLAGRGGRTTYAAGRGNWRVVSGADRAGTIFYGKVLQRGDQLAIFQLRYPKTANQYQSIAARMSACFSMLK
ncbi:hypothetical protein EV283_2137 [Sphingomonas sp. BK036]|uniref:hypothetical protein n=1 Tax=Sphingomonas sp. BK036 TaxID=2512122 RepID=UPI0010295B43|nr:hypothetical protein [Sphingomonas sp. BK036]RZT52898.1 hypothetical protein EV283_2137 [Sphingomonas sp. BK036]